MAQYVYGGEGYISVIDGRPVSGPVKDSYGIWTMLRIISHIEDNYAQKT